MVDGEDDMPLWQLASQQYAHEYSGHRRQKVFNDNIHGHFVLHRASVAVLDTPAFQRLRNLKQLGLAYQIYPSASHNRFEHSLGVAHLASEWGKLLISGRDGVGEDGWNCRRLEPEDRQHLSVLQLAGLTHDLGHGPFSHVFEKELLPRLGLDAAVVREWHHENMSNVILDHILEDPENDIDLMELAHLDGRHVSLIKSLMHGADDPAAAYPAAPWLFSVVANKATGIDVDKFDYLQRDAAMTGVATQLDARRLMLFSRLSPSLDEICFKQTEYSNLAVGLFQSRAEMHRRVYTHQKIKSVEFMVCDALALAAGPLGLRDTLGCADTAGGAVGAGGVGAGGGFGAGAGAGGAGGGGSRVEDYLLLDDSILGRLAGLDPQACEKPGDILKAQALLRSLGRRKLYKFVEEVTLDVDAQQRYTGLPTPGEIVACQSATQGVTLNPDDVIVCEIHIDHGKKGRNPMAGVRFYQTSDAAQGDAPFAMPQQQVSSMLGTVYQDKIIRVYSKTPDKAACKALKDAFCRWSTQKHNCQPPGTPWRQGGHHQHQQHPHATRPSAHSHQHVPAADGLNGRAAEMGALAQQLQYNSTGSAFGSQPRSSSSGPDGGSQPDQQQHVLHIGSGGRSRKRSLHSDLGAAVLGAAAGGAAALDGGSSSQEPVVLSLGSGLGSGSGSGGVGRPPKVARASGLALAAAAAGSSQQQQQQGGSLHAIAEEE